MAGTLPRRAWAAGEPIKLGILTPLTGAGGNDGPRMAAAMKAVAAEVNAAGGVLGSQIELIVEDDQTNPDAAVRAARKLIDVDKVPVIMGTWASAVTTAVAPVCWESKVFLTTVSGADSITLLPHQGYLIRTQPNNKLQAASHAAFIASIGMKRVYIMAIQAPFAVPTQVMMATGLRQHGSQEVGALIYDGTKTSFRSEVDQALRAKPDLLYLNGYAPDVTIVLKNLYEAGYTGAKFAQSYVLTPKVLGSLPHEVTDGTYAVQPSPDVESKGYALAAKRMNVPAPDSYICQATDWMSLVALTIQKAGAATGTAVRDNVRKISNNLNATKVYSAVEGLALLKQGKEIKYVGASGPCEFDPKGDILSCKFRYDRIKDGAYQFIKIT
ncbi:MAG TPA: ABC transporter substrate-binding protein [bacterium]|nr:ABC transporter substrate-binding protein [bacterium]